MPSPGPSDSLRVVDSYELFDFGLHDCAAIAEESKLLEAKTHRLHFDRIRDRRRISAVFALFWRDRASLRWKGWG